MEKIPKEVLEYMAMTSVNGGMLGLKMFTRCQEIINKYPNWFQWEHKYKSIPKEVHDAYIKERNPNIDKPLVLRDGFNGILNELKDKSNAVNLGFNKEGIEGFSISKALSEIFKAQEDARIELKKEEAKSKELWDKHYKKYKLEYRPKG